MNTEREFAYKVRHHLNQGAEELDRKTADGCCSPPECAAHQKTAGAQLSLAGMGHIAADVIFPHAGR
jgi:hypothetical protein